MFKQFILLILIPLPNIKPQTPRFQLIITWGLQELTIIRISLKGLCPVNTSFS